MNLAFANLNRATPDVAAAERYAASALALVPEAVGTEVSRWTA